MKTTSNGRRPQNIKSWISQQPLIGSASNFKLKLKGPNKIKNSWIEDDLQWKTTSNIKSWISQQPLIGSSSNFKLKLRGTNQNIKYSKWRWPPMEDDLKMLKVEYLSNHSSDPPQILNLRSGDQTKIKMLDMKTTSNGRRPQNIKSWISQQPLIRSSSNFKLKLRRPNTVWIVTYEYILEENSEEISSVALLSPACFS